MEAEFCIFFPVRASKLKSSRNNVCDTLLSSVKQQRGSWLWRVGANCQVHISLYIAKNSGSAALGITRNETGEKKNVSRQGATKGVFEGATQECARRRKNGISVDSGPSRIGHGIVGNIIPV